jgi:hypothetical protein
MDKLQLIYEKSRDPDAKIKAYLKDIYILNNTLLNKYMGLGVLFAEQPEISDRIDQINHAQTEIKGFFENYFERYYPDFKD